MLKLATLLSTDFDYIRVDIYTLNYGKAKIEPSEWDLKLG